MDNVILIKEAVKEYILSYGTLYNAYKNENIESTRSGNQIYLYRESVAEFKRAWEKVHHKKEKEQNK